MELPTTRTLTSVLIATAVFAASCSSAAEDFSTTAPADSSADGFVEVAASSGFFDSSIVHDLAIDFDEDDYAEMVTTFEVDGDKEWIEATVTIDGTVFENAGVRLKGNSSLRGLTLQTAENPEELPWLIKLDKYVDDQDYEGIHDIVIRSNSTETSLNEAVAQGLLAITGLAAEDPAATVFTVNESEAQLRLAIEHPDEIWEDENFDTDNGALYKADSTGDYSYRGDDWDAYDDVFDQKVGEDDLDPLISFLDFINNADDETFANELGELLDVESFATYLAFQDLVQNGDDIDGRGNNSYLHYDYETERFTVVSWDLNLAFNTANVSTGANAGGGQFGQGGRPDRGNIDHASAERGFPTDGGRPEQRVIPGQIDRDPEASANTPTTRQGNLVGAGSTNVLSGRFLANATFAALYDQAVTDLTQMLFASGVADDLVSHWTELLALHAGDLVTITTIDNDAAAITGTFPI